MQRIIIQDSQTFIQTAVSLFTDITRDAIAQRCKCSVALSGGSTPKPLYRALAEADFQGKIDWQNIHLFWGDERDVVADHPDSNYRMVDNVLLHRISIPLENVHRVPTEKGLPAAAFVYENQMRHFFTGDWPQFDLVLLGMGEDGHTASLFPFSDGLSVTDRWFVENFAPIREEWRLTLTKNAINAARNILILIKGIDKAPMVAEVLAGERYPEEKPLQLVNPSDGQLIWLLDKDAASLLPSELLHDNQNNL